jgi:hypothetical protein
VLSDWLVVRVTVNPGEAFLDRMISMVESARRRRPAKSHFDSAREADMWRFLLPR